MDAQFHKSNAVIKRNYQKQLATLYKFCHFNTRREIAVFITFLIWLVIENLGQSLLITAFFEVFELKADVELIRIYWRGHLFS